MCLTHGQIQNFVERWAKFKIKFDKSNYQYTKFLDKIKINQNSNLKQNYKNNKENINMYSYIKYTVTNNHYNNFIWNYTFVCIN